MRDKDIRSLQKFVSQAHTCLFFKPRMERSATREYLEKYIVFSAKKRVFWCETINESLAHAQRIAGPRDLICVTGSLFAVGEARELLCRCSTHSSGRISM
jgi:dihydrofolate synthase/folylpolyglutamate synthase